MKRGHAAAIMLAAALLNAAPAAPGIPSLRPAGLSDAWDAEPLGWVRVTQYTHVETHSRLTASGHVINDADEGRLCAISRDWWRGRVKAGDLVWVDGFKEPCTVLDTMARANAKGFPQTRWIDVYVRDPKRALDFGIRHANAYIVRPGARAR